MTISANKNLRDSISHSLNAMEMISFNDGFEAALSAIDELSEIKHSEKNDQAADILRWAAMELRGENA